MTYGKLVPMALALGICGFALSGPTATQAAPVSTGLAAITDAKPNLVVDVQRRRHHRHRHYRHGRGGSAVGAGIAAGILGAAAGAIILNEATRAPGRCWVETNPYTGAGYWARC